MFLFGKLVWAVLQPGNLLVLLLVAGVLLGLFGRPRRGDFPLRLATILLLAVAVLPVGPALLLPLESRFPRPAQLPTRIAGILVLGGTVDARLSQRDGRTVFSHSPARLLAGARLARAHPEARLAVLGGEGGFFPEGYAEAAASLPFLLEQGIARSRIVLEKNSRSTHENAVFGKKLLQPKPGENWVLVTSAFHMPRAVAAFRGAGWPVIAYPVDFTVDPQGWFEPGFDLVGGLEGSTTAGKEWVGLLAYRLFGWSQELFPAPPSAAPPGAAGGRAQNPWKALKAESALQATNIVTPVQ